MRCGVEPRQILEGEHQRLDALGGVAVVLLERGDEARLGLAVEGVEDLGHLLVAVAALGLASVDMNSVRSVCSIFSRISFCTGSSAACADDVHRQLLGQDRQHAGGMLGRDLGQHDGDGLRVFVLEVVGEHVLLHVGELLPHVAAGRPADLLHDDVDAVGRQELLKQALGGIVVADERAGVAHVEDELDHQLLDELGLHLAEPRHRQRDQPDLLLVEGLPHDVSVLAAEREEENRGAVGPRQVRQAHGLDHGEGGGFGFSRHHAGS